MLHEVLLFNATKARSNDRFDEFIRWGQPSGEAHINDIHGPNYRPSTPYFSWASRFLSHGDLNARSWFLKREYLHSGRAVFKRVKGDTEPVIYNRDGLISEGRFLEFAKAYLNVIAYYRRLRSPSKATVFALIFLEKALRDLNTGRNDPADLKLLTFEKAAQDLSETSIAPSLQYDVSKELEMVAGMLQSGYQSKSFRFEGKGFRLLEKPFAFKSGMPPTHRLRAIAPDARNGISRMTKRLSSEVVAAIGLAYRKAVSLHGPHTFVAFMAAVAGLPFVTTSMRMSEFIILARDALYLSEDGTRRYRLRISRPKINTHQDLPLPYKLGELAAELFECIKSNTADAHEAFQFYIREFGDNFEDINSLFIPEHLRNIFSKEFLTLEDINTIFGTSVDYIAHTFPCQTLEINFFKFIDKPGDISPLASPNARILGGWAKIGEIERALKRREIKTHFPVDADRHQYVNAAAAWRYIEHRNIRKNKAGLNSSFWGEKKACHYIRSSELRSALLREFKARRPPHWPYVTKDKTTKVNDALLVWFEIHKTSGEEKTMWWCPAPIQANTINSWISPINDKPAILFDKLNIRLKDNSYPSFTLHQTRKYHHTVALLAGANEAFIDELAGRKTGRQSDHYDLRTPHEILIQSIETFDPDEDFKVIGPVAEQALKVKIVDRKAFIYKNAAPKHITEVGGCTTDWSLNPCDQFGSCTRCDKQVWRKGDKKRLPLIKDKRKHAMEMIDHAEKKMKLGDQPHSLQRQLQQFKDDLARCDAILTIEANSSIEVGTIVTFNAAEGASGASELTSRLRNESADNNLDN